LVRTNPLFFSRRVHRKLITKMLSVVGTKWSWQVIVLLQTVSWCLVQGISAPPLPRNLNIDPTSITVSGISSGAAMSNQVAVAFSAQIAGAAAFAGKPWNCEKVSTPGWAPGHTSSTCNGKPDLINISALVAALEAAVGAGMVDPSTNLRTQRNFVMRGLADPIYLEGAVNKTVEFYRAAGVPHDAVWDGVDQLDAGHCIPTDRCTVPPCKQCNQTGSPYLNACAYDGAGAALQWMYGPHTQLTPRAPKGGVNASWHHFDQTPFSEAREAGKGRTGGKAGTTIAKTVTASGLGERGWIYIPHECYPPPPGQAGVADGHAAGAAAADGTRVGAALAERDSDALDAAAECKLHVSFHGCGMDEASLGNTFVRNAGFVEWAETNRIVVLFPQTGGVFTNGTFNYTMHCWDNYGITGPNYAAKGGAMMAPIGRMLTALTSNG
jgi:hypothetical protein